MENREKGSFYEDKALQFLMGRGYSLLEKNFRGKHGEIDLIVKKDFSIVFVEVKYRRSTRFGVGAEAVDMKKQRRIYLTAMDYIQRNEIKDDESLRFDLISFIKGELTWSRNIIWGENIGI